MYYDPLLLRPPYFRPTFLYNWVSLPMDSSSRSIRYANKQWSSNKNIVKTHGNWLTCSTPLSMMWFVCEHLTAIQGLGLGLSIKRMWNYPITITVNNFLFVTQVALLVGLWCIKISIVKSLVLFHQGKSCLFSGWSQFKHRCVPDWSPLLICNWLVRDLYPDSTTTHCSCTCSLRKLK